MESIEHVAGVEKYLKKKFSLINQLICAWIAGKEHIIGCSMPLG